MQKGMVQAFNRYVCYIKPAKGDKKAEEQYVEVKYARARVPTSRPRTGRKPRSRSVTWRSTTPTRTPASSRLSSTSSRSTCSFSRRARAPECFDDMAKDVPVFLELYCKGNKFEDNKESCETLTRIQFDIQRLRAQKIVERADQQLDKGQAREAVDNYKKGADAYLDLWRGYCEALLPRARRSSSASVRTKSSTTWRARTRRPACSRSRFRLVEILLDPKYGMHESELAQKAIYEIGGNYQAIAVYDRAADYFERYADASKYKGEFADQALSDAVVLRLGLGQDDLAIKDADAFNRYYGARKPAQAAQIAFAVAAHYGEKKDWGNVEKKLAGAMRLIDGKATVDVQAQAHALLGRAYAKSNKGAVAAKEYGKVVALWKDPKAAVAAIEGLAGEDAERQAAPARAARSRPWANRFSSSRSRRRRRSIRSRSPSTRAKGSKEAVLKHIGTKVKDWIGKKRPLIDEASVEYKKIVDLQPVPPPRWVIAAGSRVGEMWGTFVKEFRAAPIPDSMKKDYEIRTAYYGALDEASEPQKQQAKGAYDLCLGYSVKYQYFDEYSRACESGSRRTPTRPSTTWSTSSVAPPNRVNSVLRSRVTRSRIGGDPIAAQTAEPPGPAEEEGRDQARGQEVGLVRAAPCGAALITLSRVKDLSFR